MILDEWIAGTPRPQGNPQQITKHYSRYPSTTIEHRNEVIRFLRVALGSRGAEPFDCAVKLSAKFYFQRPKSHYGTGRNAETLRDSAPPEHIQTPDVDKLVRLISDALTIAGVIADDRLIVDVRGRKFWTATSAGTSIWVAPV